MIQNNPQANEDVKKIHHFEALTHEVSVKDVVPPESSYAQLKDSNKHDTNAIELCEASIVIKEIF